MPLVEPSTYKPPRYLKNKHLQTIFPALFRKVSLSYHRERITTPDHDFLDLDWVYNDSPSLVIISHGLEGNSTRPYVKGLAKALNDNGYDALAWNFRGCSGEINKQLRFYHSGATDDLDIVIQHALKRKEYSQIALAGFSLGGNLTLKYLGEKERSINPVIKKAIVFSVPLDLHTSCIEISKPHNYLYSSRFLRRLKQKVRDKSLLLPEKINLDAFKNIRNLKDFDDFYTAPLHGFTDALNYYRSCSAINFLEKINLPTLIVNAKNDPFLSKDCFPEDLLRLHPYVYLEAPEEGGHCGFYARNNKGYYWSEQRAIDFLNGKQEAGEIKI